MDPFKLAQEMQQKIKEAEVKTAEQLEAFRIEFLGSKNKIKPLFGAIREVANEKKKEFGQLLNQIKQEAEARYADLKKEIESASREDELDQLDLTRPGDPIHLGSRHPISIVTNRIIDIFVKPPLFEVCNFKPILIYLQKVHSICLNQKEKDIIYWINTSATF